MKNFSCVIEKEKTNLPEFTGERIYMQEFFQKKGLPPHLSRWQHTVDAMLDGIITDGPIYLMVDQALVLSNHFHRRPGVHIDGYWIPSVSYHGGHRINLGSHGGHRIELGRHKTHFTSQDIGYHRNTVPSRHNTEPTPIPSNPGRHNSDFPREHHNTSPSIKPRNNLPYEKWEDEGLILVSNISACRAWHGIYEGIPKEGGDCSHIDLTNLSEITMQPDTIYAGNVTMLHESLPVKFDCQRTVVRLNVPGWSPDN